MKSRNILPILFIATAMTASAVPAKPGAVYRYTQPDGTTVELSPVGDERSSYYLTEDGHAVIGYDNQYIYADIDTEGRLIHSGVLAHDISQRTDTEKALVARLDRDNVVRKISQVRTASRSSNDKDGIGVMSTAFPTLGEVRSIVFLVEYQDVSFDLDDAHDYFTRMLNQEGFSDDNAMGSARDYFLSASCGKFVPTFDVYGPVVLPKERSYYGKNLLMGSDAHPEEMLRDAARLLDDDVDFSQYDLDGDGFVDNVFVFYAGGGEANGGGADTVWPHQSEIYPSSSYRFDNVYISRYACSSELTGGDTGVGKIDGIGTFCHEFAHVLGLPDLYNTENSSVYYTPGEFSIIDMGCYNGDSRIPPTMSAYERNALRWMGDDLVKIDGPASCRLEPIIDSNKAYLVDTDRENEFYLFENRQKTKGTWDQELPYHGMLVWHIDYNATQWRNNTVNNNEKHQYVDLVEANGETSSNRLHWYRYPFPGSKKVTQFVYGGVPSFESWSGADMGLPITNITETDGIITFDVAGGGDDPAGIKDVANDMTGVDIRVSGRTIAVTAESDVNVTDVMGRTIATGHKTATVSAPCAGIYIVTTATGSRKVVVR